MRHDFRIARLTAQFYEKYPREEYPEILLKQNRAYSCLRMKLWDNLYICIPFRTEMRHANGYHFTSSERSKAHHSGLDFSKLVVTNAEEDICTDEAVVDKDEYVECVRNMKRIFEDVSDYICDYIDCRVGRIKLHPREFQRRYQYATLQYFEKELGIY